MPASQPQPITDVAKPVIVIAACRAQRALSAVMITRGRAHAEGFGEGVVDADALDGQRAHGTTPNGSGRPSAWSGTLMKSSDRP